jgi:peptidoglycan-associated lipoprotein
MKKIYLLVACLSFSLGSVFAQPIRSLNPEKTLQIADEKLAQGDTYNALIWYEKVYEEDNKNAEAIRKIADLHYQLRDFKKAETWSSRLVKREKDNYDYLYRYANVLKMNGKYDEASTQFEAAKALLSAGSPQITLCNNQIAGCELAKEFTPDDAVTVANVGKSINSPFTELSPFAVNETEIYYAAIRSDSAIVVQNENQDIYSKVYTAVKNGANWSQGKILEGPVNKFGFHTGNVSLSTDQNTMYFTRCELNGNQLKRCDIYSAKKSGSSWTDPTKLNISSDQYTVKQPYVADYAGKTYLFFSSNMPGGVGGWDIYYTTQKGDGSFSTPLNVGANINTIADEETPSFFDGHLFFSSNGLPGVGGYDVFKSKWNGNGGSEPTNMGLPVNSRVDDLYFNVDKSGYNGYVVSNRPGTTSLKSETCCDDIFSVTFAKPQPIALEVSTYDVESKANLEGVTVELTGDAFFSKTLTQPNSNVFQYGTLTPGVTYNIKATKEGYELVTDQITTGSDTRKPQNLTKKLYLRKIPPPPPPVVVTKEIVLPDLPVLNWIYYDFDKADIRPDAQQTLNAIADVLKQYPQLKVEMSSHTDARGSSKYNEKLAARRADAAFAYLQKMGVPASQIVRVTSFGEDKPVAENELNGKDNPDGRQLNRRTEFHIVSGTEGFKVSSKVMHGATGLVPTTTTTTTTTTTKIQSTTTTTTASTPVKPAKKLPKVTFTEAYKDFGKLTEGDKREHTFEFTNTGNADLLIEFVSASCGCTVPEDYPRTAIPPGGKGKIRVNYDSHGKAGEQINDITVIANTDPIISEAKIRAYVNPK